MFSTVIILLALLLPAQAKVLRVDIDGMTCTSCGDKVIAALDKLAFLSKTAAPNPEGMACASLDGVLDKEAVSAAMADLGYTAKAMSITDNCETGDTKFPQNWAEIEGLNVLVISNGDEVELSDHAAAGKFTIYDFGAPWCAPCHVAEKMLKDYLRDHDDVAVRAIILDSQNPKDSFNLPAAHQHLRSAPGLPYFVAVNAQGKAIFKGSDVARLLKKIDKKR